MTASRPDPHDRPDSDGPDGPDGPDDRHERYVEAVLSAVESVPPGRVTTYGDVAVRVGEQLGRGGPRQVGSVLAAHGGAVCWWRVVRADGQPARGHEQQALRRLAAEGVPVLGGRVRLETARWRWPELIIEPAITPPDRAC